MYTITSLIVVAALAVPGNEKKEAPKDLDKVQGVWKLTAAVSRGAPAPVALMQSPTYILVVAGESYVFTTHGGSMALDADKHTVDFTVQAGRYKGLVIQGRYELKGETLTLILPSPIQAERPAELKPGGDPVGIVYTFERDGKANKERDEATVKDRMAALPAAKGGFKGVGGVGGPGGGAAGGAGPGGAAPGGLGGGAMTTQQMLQQILQRLERIEQRLDALEKRLPPSKEEK